MLIFITLACLGMKLAYMLISEPLAELWPAVWGFRPAAILAILARPPAEWLHYDMAGLVTALFVHMDWLHLAGNLAYLWVFGVAVERALGHWQFLASFLLLGSLANFYLAWQTGDSVTPVIGASGGVSAVIGLYLGLFPRRRMGLWLPLGLYLQFARVPALLVIGSWFILQLIYSVFSAISATVGWWSHIGGFAAGLVLAMILRMWPASVDLTAHDDPDS